MPSMHAGSKAAPSPNTVPQFRLRLLDGTVVRTSDLQGKVTIIDFWAVWCGPCLAEIGDYNLFYREYKNKGIRFIALAADSGTEQEVRAAVKKLKIEYPVAATSMKELETFGDILVFPTTWVIDSKGKLTKEILGVPPNKHKALRTLVDSLLKETRKN